MSKIQCYTVKVRESTSMRWSTTYMFYWLLYLPITNNILSQHRKINKGVIKGFQVWRLHKHLPQFHSFHIWLLDYTKSITNPSFLCINFPWAFVVVGAHNMPIPLLTAFTLWKFGRFSFLSIKGWEILL